MIKKKRKNKITANESERIILQLYYLNKKKKKEAILPMNDFRRSIVKKTNKEESTLHLIPLKKAFLKDCSLVVRLS